MKFAEWAKAYVALAGLVAQGLLAEATFLPAGWLYPIRVVAIGATAVAVWRVPNAPSVPPPPAWPAGTTFPAWDQEADVPEKPDTMNLLHFPTRPEEYRLAA
jgi:hypothetical protein